MNIKLYYVDFVNGKFRIFKEYVDYIEGWSTEKYVNIVFINGVERKNCDVFEKRRKARQNRDFLNKNFKREMKESD